MSKNKKLNAAATRIRSSKKSSAKPVGFWARVWNIICAPFRFIGRMLKAFWKWVKSLDTLALFNVALLIAIILIFIILLIRVIPCATPTKKPSFANVEVEKTVKKPVDDSILAKVKVDKDMNATITLPLKKVIARPVPDDKVEATKAPGFVKVEPTKNREFADDVIIDGEDSQSLALTANDRIAGNLFLQNMYRYTLPCGVVIDGNLVMRNVGIVKFCGGFTVKNNIIVSRESSFGPLPRDARIGGSVLF